MLPAEELEQRQGHGRRRHVARRQRQRRAVRRQRHRRPPVAVRRQRRRQVRIRNANSGKILAVTTCPPRTARRSSSSATTAPPTTCGPGRQRQRLPAHPQRNSGKVLGVANMSTSNSALGRAVRRQRHRRPPVADRPRRQGADPEQEQRQDPRGQQHVDRRQRPGAAVLRQRDRRPRCGPSWPTPAATGIQNVNSGKVLAVSGMSTADSAPVVQFSDNGTADHLWRLLPGNSGRWLRDPEQELREGAGRFRGFDGRQREHRAVHRQRHRRPSLAAALAVAAALGGPVPRPGQEPGGRQCGRRAAAPDHPAPSRTARNPACHSSRASTISSCERATKFHHMTSSSSRGTPPSRNSRVTFEAQ